MSTISARLGASSTFSRIHGRKGSLMLGVNLRLV